MKKSNVSLSSNLTCFLLFTNKPTHLSSLPAKHINPLNPTHHQHAHVPHPISNLSNRKDPAAFAAALAAASAKKSPILGTQIHSQIIKAGFSNDVFSQNNLLVMYSRCQHPGHALNLFHEMAERNIVSWTSMISGFIHNNEHEMGLEFYVGMARSGFHPNEFALASVLTACAALEAGRLGCSIHSVALKIGMDPNPFVGSSLLCMYANCGNIEASEHAFECVSHRDLACWNAMVEGYASKGYGYDALRTVSLMHRKGLIADQFTYVSALKGCSITGDINLGRQIHSLVVHYEYEFSTMVMNSLTDMYFRIGTKDYALRVFSRTQEKDNVSWNTVICGFTQEEDERGVVALFAQMLSTGLKPNQVTFSVILRLCGAKEDLSLGFQFCCMAYHLGFFNDILVVNSLINMLSKCGEVESALFLFSSLPTRSTITWNEMIAGYTFNGYGLEASKIFCNSIESGVRADEFTYSSVLGACHGAQDRKIGEQIHANIIKSGFRSCCCVGSSLVNAYARFESIGSSFKVFEDVGVPDLVSWGVMISALSKQGFSCEALSLLNRLREAGEEPDEFILGSALNACANIAVLNQCRCIHSDVIKKGYENHLYVASAVIDAYAKCGDISGSKRAFDNISSDDDAVLFNTMITAYAHHGLIAEAIDAFGRLREANLYPTHATFVAVISACSHLGLVDQGQDFFNSIGSDYGMCPSKDNFACLVDLLARNGLLDRARDVIERMSYKPWPAIWRSLLSGCRIHGNKEMGELAAERILKLMPGNDGAYVLLSHVYAEDGRWEDVEKVRMKMEEKGVQKVPGFSTIEL